MKKYIAAAVLLTIIGLGFRLFIALRLPTDEPDDGRLYARIALNILEHRSYSIETEEPYPPTYIRVPGYPLLLAGIYALFGHENNRAVRVVQAVLDTITCWLIALLALAWRLGNGSYMAYRPCRTGTDRRRRLLLIALALAVCCPFPAIYVATILSETCTTLLAVTCALSGTLAMKTAGRGKSIGWFVLAGLTGGLATLFRPDSGLFVAAVGFTVVLVGLYRAIIRRRTERPMSDVLSGSPRQILGRTILSGAMLTIGFAIALTPWAIRNARVFGVFQPIAPSQANMPGEFVPNGYIGWLRTWVDDVKYTESIEFPLDQEQIHIEDMPDFAFDSQGERERVAELLDRYNHPYDAAGNGPLSATPAPETKPPEQQPDLQKQSTAAPSESDEDAPEEADPPDDEADTPEEPEPRPPVEMTPEVDAGFAELTHARIARHPIRYYVGVPLKRAASMWFDTHSQYYPFQGELLPLSALDTDLHQQYWLPLFALLTFFYTSLGLIGAWLMWRDKSSRRWLLLLALLIVPRLAMLARMENPEPRYVVEYFAFVVATAGIATSALYDLLYSKMKVMLRRNKDDERDVRDL